MALEAFTRVLPILLLVGLGALIRRRGLLAASTVDDLRRFIVTITLPATLFGAFLRVDLEARYAIIVVSVFGACVAVLAVAPFLRRAAGIRATSMPDLMAGFEAGMLGIPLFVGVFGADQLYHFAIVEIGQELFVFFILVTVVVQRASGRRPPLAETVGAFFRHPVILAILAGIGGSLIGLGDRLDANPFGEALLTTIGLLAALTTPLIAIVLGYSTSLRLTGLRDPARTLAVRLPIWIALALVFNAVVIERLLGLDRLFGAAVMTMAILPPPFVVPLYMARALKHDPEHDPEHVYAVNTLSLATLVALAAIVVVGLVYAG
jgi:malate permease and related proteins